MKNSLKHRFLLGAPTLPGEFGKSVLFVFEHGKQGAMGVALNRPSACKCPHCTGTPFKLNIGGPMSTDGAIFLLHGNEDLAENSIKIMDGFYIGQDSCVENMLEKPKDDQVCFFISGFCPWQSGQLESELANNFWTVLDKVDADDIFHIDLDYMWENLVEKHKVQFKPVIDNTLQYRPKQAKPSPRAGFSSN